MYVLHLLFPACSTPNRFVKWHCKLTQTFNVQVGVLVAALAEVLASRTEGLFGCWGADELNLLGATGILLLSCTALLAASSKRHMGRRLTEAVLTSLTALSGVKMGARQQSLDSAVDCVFDQVFSSSMIHHNFLEDDHI